LTQQVFTGQVILTAGGDFDSGWASVNSRSVIKTKQRVLRVFLPILTSQNTMPETNDAHLCSGCKVTKSLAEFEAKSDGSKKKTCLVCTRRTRQAKQNQKKGEKENIGGDVDMEEEDFGHGLDVFDFHGFLDALTQLDDNLKLQARVDISSKASGSRRERADMLATAIWDKMKYRFVCVSEFCWIQQELTVSLFIATTASTIINVPNRHVICITALKLHRVSMLQRRTRGRELS
jgi:hypothetical protein